MATAEMLKPTAAPAKRMRSVEAARAGWFGNANLRGSALLLYQALASHSDENFQCYPSIARLAEMTKLGERQVQRKLRELQTVGAIKIDGKGGKGWKNTYTLLLTNGDISKGDTAPKGDISRPETVTSGTQRVTPGAVKGDIAMSPEGFESLVRNGEILNGAASAIHQTVTLTKSGSRSWDLPIPTSWTETRSGYRDKDLAIEEADSDTEAFLQRVLGGSSIAYSAHCNDHGPFSRIGYTFDNWIAWAGTDSMTGDWSHDAGCAGCAEAHAAYNSQLSKKEREFQETSRAFRRFELLTPAICNQHGAIVVRATLREKKRVHLPEHEQRVELILSHMENCEQCESEWEYESQLRHSLEWVLTDEQWEKGRSRILGAIQFANS